MHRLAFELLVQVRAWDISWQEAHPHALPAIDWLAQQILVVSWWAWQALGLN